MRKNPHPELVEGWGFLAVFESARKASKSPLPMLADTFVQTIARQADIVGIIAAFQNVDKDAHRCLSLLLMVSLSNHPSTGSG
jgi:hypothetical protein